MKLLQSLSILCLGSCLIYGSSDNLLDFEDFSLSESFEGADFGRMSSDADSGIGGNAGKEEVVVDSGTHNTQEATELDRVGGAVSDIAFEDILTAIGSGNDLLVSEGVLDDDSKPTSPLVKYDAKQGGRMLPFDFDGLERGENLNENIVRQFAVLTTAVVLHTIALIELLSTPVDLCYAPWAKGASYMCLINSAFFSLMFAGYSFQVLKNMFPYFMSAHAMPVAYVLYYLAQGPQCPFEIEKY